MSTLGKRWSTKDAILRVRISPEEITRLHAEAEKYGETLSECVRTHLRCPRSRRARPEYQVQSDGWGGYINISPDGEIVSAEEASLPW